ncbi:alpha/beta hydrolase [Halobacteriales archaeon Cl-PHB]
MTLAAHDVTASDGLRLNVWAREPQAADEAVLFVHGIVTNGRALFGTPVEGDDSYSWLHQAADLGRAAFAIDQRGYGDSERPPEMDEPPAANDPPVRADTAARDIASVVEWVRESYDVVHLVGVSWGTHTTGTYVELAGPPVASLSLVAPVWKPAYDFDVALEALDIPDYDRAWFEQSRDTVRARSDHPPDVFDAMWRAQVESGQGKDEDTYVVQSGGIADWAASTAGNPVWDPQQVDVPTMVFYGGDDEIADRRGSIECYDEVGTERKEYAEMAGVDHYMMHGERRREVFELVDDFQNRV